MYVLCELYRKYSVTAQSYGYSGNTFQVSTNYYSNSACTIYTGAVSYVGNLAKACTNVFTPSRGYSSPYYWQVSVCSNIRAVFFKCLFQYFTLPCCQLAICCNHWILPKLSSNLSSTIFQRKVVPNIPANSQTANSIRVAFYSSLSACQQNFQNSSALLFMSNFVSNECEAYGTFNV